MPRRTTSNTELYVIVLILAANIADNEYTHTRVYVLVTMMLMLVVLKAVTVLSVRRLCSVMFNMRFLMKTRSIL